MKHSYEITYKNVRLRPLTENDIENLRIWRNNPRNTKYLNKMPFISPEMQSKWYQNYIENTDEICFAIDENSKLNRLVGSCSLYNFDGDSCFFGKILIGDEEAHGRKVGLNATLAAVEIAFEQLRVNEIKLFVYSDNIAAINVYESAQFEIVNKCQSSFGNTEYTMKRYKENNMIQNMNEVKIIEFPQRGDERGNLVIIEGEEDIPFEIKRAFYIYGSEADVVRGQHANRESEFVLINVAGKSKVKVKDGRGNEIVYCLDHPHTGIYLPPMVWKDMYDFSSDSVLLVLASTHYDANEYIRDYDIFEQEIARMNGKKS